MKSIYLIVISFFFSYFFFISPVFAVNLTIEQSPSVITDQPFTIDVSLAGASAGQNYLRLDLYKDGTSNYFGETSVGSNWYSGSDGTQYVPITIVDPKTVITATLQARLGTPSTTDFPGSGNYKLRVRRYTASGNSSTTDETPADIQITYSLPTPTPTVTPSPTPTSVPTPTKTPSPTKIPTPTKILTVTPLSVKTPTPMPSKIPTPLPFFDQKEKAKERSHPTSVLGISDSNVTPSPSPIKSEVIVKGSSDTSSNLLTFIFCGLGTMLLLICGILVYQKRRRGDSLPL